MQEVSLYQEDRGGMSVMLCTESEERMHVMHEEESIMCGEERVKRLEQRAGGGLSVMRGESIMRRRGLLRRETREDRASCAERRASCTESEESGRLSPGSTSARSEQQEEAHREDAHSHTREAKRERPSRETGEGSASCAEREESVVLSRSKRT